MGDAVGRAAIGFMNFAQDGIAGGLVTFVQMLVGPVIVILMIFHGCAFLLAWIIGPLTIGLIMYKPDYFTKWLEDFVALCMWPILAEFIISVIAYMRVGTISDGINPSNAWLSAAFSAALIFMLIQVPKWAKFGEGVVSGMAAAAASFTLGAVANAATRGMGTVGGGIEGEAKRQAAKQASDKRQKAEQQQKERAGDFYQGRYSENKDRLNSDYSANPKGATGRAYLRAVSNGETASVDQWIEQQARQSALRDLRDAKYLQEVTGKQPEPSRSD